MADGTGTMRIAVTGSSGRLGSAVAAAVRAQPAWIALPWGRAELDLDDPSGVGAALDRDRPDVVVHCAAWTDVDGCAREPDLAERRNGGATGALATACARRGIGLAAVSTNEVFDGARTDGLGYRPTDPTNPANPYGRSKRLGEELAEAAFEAPSSGARNATAPSLWIVRTSWLFGPPGGDFPQKILAAARAAAAEGRPMRLVADEIGSPTSTTDLAAGILDLVATPASAGICHVVNAGHVSRAGWARRVLALAGVDVTTEDVSMDTWTRASTPPRWGVLEPTPLPTLGRLPAWDEALEADLARRGPIAAEGRRATPPAGAAT